MSFGSISDRISTKLDEIVHDKNQRQFIIELLNYEARYESDRTDIKQIKKEFENLVDQYYPYEEQNE